MKLVSIATKRPFPLLTKSEHRLKMKAIYIKIMTFPPGPADFPPISVTSEFALPGGTPQETAVIIDPPTDAVLGVEAYSTVVTTAFANNIFVSVLDANGDPLPIDKFILSLSEPVNDSNLDYKVGLQIDFSLASVPPEGSVSLEDMFNTNPDAFNFFAIYFAEVINAKTNVSGFHTFTQQFANSNYNLSQGNDAVITTTLNNVVYGNAGDDAIVVDAYSFNPGTTTKSGFILGSGNDDVQVTKAALRQNKSRIDIIDFNSAEDTLSLQTKEKRVDGIGTDKLKITTKKAKFAIKSIESGGIFEENSIDFI